MHYSTLRIVVRPQPVYDGGVDARYHLVALTLPGNQTRQLEELKGRLFREAGLASARTLEPLVPLYWCEERGAAQLPHRSTLRLGAPLHLGRFETRDGLILLTIHPQEVLESLGTQLERMISRSSRTLFAPQFGIFMAHTEGLSSRELRRLCEDMDGAVPAATVRALSVSLLRISVRGEQERFWHRLSWEELVTAPVRKPRAQE